MLGQQKTLFKFEYVYKTQRQKHDFYNALSGNIRMPDAAESKTSKYEDVDIK